MTRIADHLYQSGPEHPFGNDVTTCAYLLARPQGNVLIYSSGTLAPNEGWIREQGGISVQYLNHRDEASESCDWVRDTFGAPLICHDAERDAVAGHCTVDATFNGPVELHPDLQAIPTPGHCPGSTCYLWQGPDRGYLFTGDTLFLRNGEWRVFVNLGTAEEMIDSLRRLAALNFDVVVPGLFIGDIAYASTTRRDFARRIEAVIKRLENGEQH